MQAVVPANGNTVTYFSVTSCSASFKPTFWLPEGGPIKLYESTLASAGRPPFSLYPWPLRFRYAVCARIKVRISTRTRDARYSAGYVSRHFRQRRRELILATVKIEDFDRFWNAFSTKGAEKRRQHGSKGAHVFRDPNEGDRVWTVFDWDMEGWQRFISDPEVPAIFQEGGLQGKPTVAEFVRSHDA